jgi:hypothetical protein
MPRDSQVTRLSDEFGQYTISLVCSKCKHARETSPLPLAKVFGWNALIVDVVKRLRCSKCGEKACKATVQLPKKPRGYTALPR